LILPAMSVCMSVCMSVWMSQIVSAPYLRNALSDFDETWHRYSSYRHDVQNQGHNHLKVMARGQRSWMSKSCPLHIFAMPHKIFTKLGKNILLLNMTCRTKVTTRSRSWLEVKGHACQNCVSSISLQHLFRF